MSPVSGFVASFLVTLTLLLGTVITGRRARRRQHFPLVFLSVASLGVTIWFAERLGEGYDLEASGVIMPIHLFLAKLATGSYILPLVTGPLTLRNAARIRWHRVSAVIVCTLTVLAAVTGVIMVSLSPPL